LNVAGLLDLKSHAMGMVIEELGWAEPERYVWTLRGRDFVCVEPWTARANALNDGQALAVAPGTTHQTSLAISLD